MILKPLAAEDVVNNLSGDAYGNGLFGSNGRDILSGKGGSDNLIGESGDDVLNANKADADGRTYDGNEKALVIGNWRIDDLSSEHSWEPGDWGADRLLGGDGYDVYRVGMLGGYYERSEDGAAVESYQDTHSLAWVFDGARFTFNASVFNRMDIILDDDGKGRVEWGLDGTDRPEIRNASGTIDSAGAGAALALDRGLTELFRHTTYRVGPLLAQKHRHYEPATGVTSDRLVFMTEPSADGASDPTVPVYGIFAIEGFFNGAFGLTLSGYRATISGNNGANPISGTAGEDNMLGQGGEDTIYGKSGEDRLEGGDDHDVLDGGSGGDRLIGGSGDDYLVGGPGADVFVFSAGFGNDRIRQFAPGTDMIEFARSLFRSFEEVIAAATQESGNTRITSGGNSLLLEKIPLESLSPADFRFN